MAEVKNVESYRKYHIYGHSKRDSSPDEAEKRAEGYEMYSEIYERMNSPDIIEVTEVKEAPKRGRPKAT